MIRNYHYIVAGLPELVPEWTANAVSYETTAAAIKEQLSPQDLRLVEWLEFGFREENLSIHFYRAAERHSDPFLAAWFRFDRQLRNAKVRYLERKAGQRQPAPPVGEWDEDFEEAGRLQQIFEMQNLIERESALDRLRWDKISELTAFDYFNIDAILGFLAKCAIADRWLRLDKAAGARLFEELVREVRGTFKGIDF